MIVKTPWTRNFAILGACVAAAIAGWSIASFPISNSHPVVLGGGGLVLAVVVFRPGLGILLLLLTAWLSQLFPGSELISLNRVIGMLALTGMVARKVLHLDARPFQVGRFDYLVWGFAVAALMSLSVNGSTDSASLARLWSMLSGYLIYFMVVNTIKGWKDLRMVAWWLLGCSLVVAISVLGGALTMPATGTMLRQEGVFTNPNWAAKFCFIGLMLVLWLAGSGSVRESRAHYLLYILIPIFILAIIFTVSRALFIALLVSTLLWPLLLRGVASRLRFVLAVLIVFILVSHVAGAFAPGAAQRMWSVLPAYGGITGGSAEQAAETQFAIAYRTGLMRAGWNMFVARPIFGVGFGGFKPLNVQYGSGLTKTGSQGHNLLLTTLGETGLVGGTLLILLYCEAFASLWKVRGISFGSDKANAVNGLFILMVGVNVVYAMTHVDTIDRSMFVIFALGTVVSRLLRSSAVEPST